MTKTFVRDLVEAITDQELAATAFLVINADDDADLADLSDRLITLMVKRVEAHGIEGDVTGLVPTVVWGIDIKSLTNQEAQTLIDDLQRTLDRRIAAQDSQR